MTVFIELREKIKAFYARYDIYILPVVKFALAMVIFIGINNMLGYLTILNNLFVVAVLALICAILPLNGTVVIGVFMIVLHCFGVGLEVGGFALLMYLLMLLLYFRFVPGDALALLMSPLAFAFNIPGTVPLALGLLRGPVSAISGAFGVVSWYFVKMVDGIVEMKSIGDASLLDVLKEMLDRLVNNKAMLLSVIACVAVVLVAATIRKLCATYAWEIAIAAGCGVYVLITLLGGLFMKVDTQLLVLIVGIAGAAVISLILEFFVYSVDYAGSQYLQFEDDEYYYYVKAIPKRLGSRSDYDRSDGDENGEQPEEFERIYGVGREKERTAPPVQDIAAAPDVPEDAAEKFQNVDFTSKLEESLKDL